MVLFNQWRPEHYRVFAVGWVLADAEGQLPGFLQEVSSSGRFRLYRAPGAGIIRLARAPYSVDVPPRQHFEASRTWLEGPGPNRSEALVIGGLSASDFGMSGLRPLPLAPASPDPTADAHSDPPGRVPADVQTGRGWASTRLEADEPALAVLAWSWHPRWRATVDGEPVPTLLVAPGFVAAPVPTGEHTVRFDYQPQAWKLPLAMGGLVVLLLAAALEHGLERHGRSHHGNS